MNDYKHQFFLIAYDKNAYCFNYLIIYLIS